MHYYPSAGPFVQPFLSPLSRIIHMHDRMYAVAPLFCFVTTQPAIRPRANWHSGVDAPFKAVISLCFLHACTHIIFSGPPFLYSAGSFTAPFSWPRPLRFSGAKNREKRIGKPTGKNEASLARPVAPIYEYGYGYLKRVDADWETGSYLVAACRFFEGGSCLAPPGTCLD